MKKLGIILSIAIIIIIAILLGIFMFNSDNKKDNKINNVNTISKIINEEKNNIITNNLTMNTNTNEEKISPNATLILKLQYKECGHIIKEYKEIPEELVNLNKEELEKKYKDWEIENFTMQSVTLIKDQEGFCGQHYVLRQKDGVIVVYKIDEEGVETLEEITGIAVDYLTENDKMEIEKGIKLNGKEELNSALENYE